MNYSVVDNFLDKESFIKIKDLVESFNFPWYYQRDINSHHSKKDLDCYFFHFIYSDFQIRSSFFNIIAPILDKIECKSLIRIKCNLYPRTEKFEIHKKHVDYPFKHKGAIFYINTNDGFTILENDIKIESIENRILFFDSSENHSSTSTTNEKSRININFNYF